MLTSLHIQNFAIIDEIQLDFAPGLTIITGETGAGKSILLGALGLVLGDRADRKAFFHQDKKCVVEARFDIGAYDLQAFFEQHDLDYDTETIIRREITPTGKSRAFINDTPVNLNVLRKLSGALLDLHRQFDTADIHDVSFQLRMLDALAGIKEQVRDYGRLYGQLVEKKRQLDRLKAQRAEASKEMDLIRFQMEELESADLKIGEDAALEEALKRIENAETTRQELGMALRHLRDDDISALTLLRRGAAAVREAAPADKRVEKQGEELDRIILDLEALADTLQAIAEDADWDPAEAERMRNRLDTIYRLQKKHQVLHVEGLLQVLADLEHRVQDLSGLDAGIEALEKETAALDKEIRAQAAAISKKRHTVVPQFEKRVTGGLRELAMPHARFKIAIDTLETPGPTGTDDVNFLFSANKGMPLQPIRGVASGGELSRLALVTKSLVAGAIPLPTILFDEIDAGVSGDVAKRMANILSRLADGHQVVVITHSPQVAAKAHVHYLIYKEDDGAHSRTRVTRLTDEARIHAIAVMLSQDPPGKAALLNAKELLADRNT